jgi:hypothetical protein
LCSTIFRLSANMFQFLSLVAYASLVSAKTVSYDFNIGWVTVSHHAAWDS